MTTQSEKLKACDECAICGKSKRQHSISSGYGVCQIYPMFVSKQEMLERLLPLSMTGEMVDKVAEALANQIAMRKGAPPIRNCLALMPPDMADDFRDNARAAIAAIQEQSK